MRLRMGIVKQAVIKAKDFWSRQDRAKNREARKTSRLQLSSLRRVNGQGRLPGRQVQVRHPSDIEESALTRVYEPKQNVLTNSTARDEAGAINVYVSISKAPLCSTISTLSFCGGQIHFENHVQFPAGGVAVQIIDICIHLCSPVEPKRSVLILCRSIPAAMSRSVACSTNDVGPQM